MSVFDNMVLYKLTSLLESVHMSQHSVSDYQYLFGINFVHFHFWGCRAIFQLLSVACEFLCKCQKYLSNIDMYYRLFKDELGYSDNRVRL